MIDENIEITEVEIDQEELEKLKEEYAAHQQEMLANVNELGGYIAEIANKAVKDKVFLEDRAIDDYRQKQGFITSDDPYQGSSKAQYSLTSVKCSAAKAKLNDIIFPAGEVNFAIVPDAELSEQEREAQEQAAEVMQDTIADYLDDSDYDHVGRKCISDCVDFGVGIIEGPIPGAKIVKKWVQVQGQNGPVNKLEIEIDTRSPVTEHVSWWDYYPDLSVAEQKDCAFEFRRHMFNSAELELLLNRDDFNQHAIKAMLSKGGDAEEPYYLQQLRDDALPKSSGDTWCVYSGYMRVPGEKLKKVFGAEHEEFEIRACDYGINEFDDDDYDIDVECVVWVSKDGDLLKITPNPYELSQRGFKTVCFDRDTSCFMASKGIPRLMHWQQLQINNLMRRMDDNSSLSSVPQCIYDPDLIEPVPSKPGKLQPEDYVMHGGKVWRARRAGTDIRKAIWFFQVPVNTPELLAELKVYIQQADEVTMLPDILLGEQSAAMTKTFHGMELLANNAMTIQQRVVKDWDDHITVKLINGYIDYVMQFRPIEGVFGVFTANAKGTSGLLMKETQSRNMLNAVQLANSNQEFHALTDWRKLYTKSLKALQAEPEEIILSDDELKKRAQQPQINPEMEKIKLGREELQVKKYVADQTVEVAKLRVLEERYRLAVQLQSQEKLTDKKLQAKEREILLKTKAKEHLMAQEYKVEATGEARIA